MSTRRRKRRGQAVDSEPVQKRSTLLASSAGGTSGAQPTDREESGPLDFELAAEETIDPTSEYFWLEATNFFVVQWEENEQHPRVSETAENSPVLQQRDNEELGNDDGSRPEWPPSPPVWVDDNSQQWEQNEQHSLLSGAAANSPVLPSRDSEEELRDDIYSNPEWPPSPPVWVDDNSQQWEQNEQHPLCPESAANSPVLPSRDNEEELRDYIYSNPEWPPSPPVWVDDNSQQWEQNEQHPLFSGAGANSAVPPSRDSEEDLSNDIYTVSSLYSSDENSQLLEAYEQQRRGLALRSQQQSNSSVLSSDDEDETRANDVCVTATASEQQGSSDEHTSSSKAWQPAIRCPICMDFYSQIRQSERLFLVTKCGHIFCSRCLPAAFEVSSACPTCRTELTEEGYHPVYI